MKRSVLKAVIKSIIKEAQFANVFRVFLFGTEQERTAVGQEFVRIGKGMLPTHVKFPSKNVTSYDIFDDKALDALESALKERGWRRQGMKDKDIFWTSPTWKANLKQSQKFGQPQKQMAAENTGVGLPPETPEDNYQTFVKAIQNSKYAGQYLIPSKEEIANEIKHHRMPVYGGAATWADIAKRYLEMYSDFAQWGTN